MNTNYSKCTVVNIKTSKYDVYIGRHPDPIIGRWGNPYSCKANTLAKYKTTTRKESIEKFKEYLLNNEELKRLLPSLKGKRLGCFCKPKSCHGDVIAELVNITTEKLF